MKLRKTSTDSESGTENPVIAARRLPPSQRRLRLPWLIIGGLLVVLGALGAYWVATAGRASTPVLAAAHTLQAGQTINDGDLKIISVDASSLQGMAYVDASQLNQAKGRQLGLTVPKDSLLTQDSMLPISLAGDEAIISLSLDDAHLPGVPIGAGRTVQVVVTPSQGEKPGAEAPAFYSATVIGTAPARDKARTILNLRVKAAEGRQIVAQAAVGRTTVIVADGAAPTPAQPAPQPTAPAATSSARPATPSTTGARQ